MKRALILGLAITCLLTAPVQGQDVLSRIKEAPKEHPRLFIKHGEEAAFREKINSDPLLREAADHVVTIADALQNVEPVEYHKIGRRLLGVSRTCLKRMDYLAAAYRLTGKSEYAARAQEEMLAVARFDDWNPSHFLDVAEMTAALAIGYDWLYPALDPDAHEEIKQAIIQKGLRTSLEGGWWVTTENNWNQVCHGGLTLGALAVMEDEPDLAAQIIERAVKNVPRAMGQYAPDGAYPEGPGYWKYGTTYNVIFLSALESVLGTDFGLTQSTGFMESSDYYLQVTGPTGLFFNYSDSGSRGGVSPAMYWFAARRQKPSLLWRERQELQAFLAEKHGPGGASNRLFPLLLVWAGDLDNTPAPQTLHWKAGGRTPIGIHRSGWKTDDATFVAVKGGSPSVNHAHMDVGTFVMDALGVRWAIDLGSQSYNDLETQGVDLWNMAQNSQRWDVFRLNNASHNTLVVDGQKQRVDGYAPITDFSSAGRLPHTIVDLSAVYKGQLAGVERGVGLRPDGSVLVQDEINTLAHNTTIRWGMVTRADVRLHGNRAILQQDGKQLTMTVLSPGDATQALFETANPPHDYDAPNKGTRMVGFKVNLPSSTQSRLVVLLRPGGEEASAIEIRPLAKW